MSGEPVRVVVADDSPFIRGLMISYLQSAGGFEVVGMAENGRQAVELTESLRPSVVTLDVEMPEMSGLEALDEIMCRVPTPVVMVSGVSIRSAEITLRAIQAGAIDFVLKYVPGVQTRPEELRLDVISKVRAAAGVRVVRSIANQLDAKRTELPHRSAPRTSDATPSPMSPMSPAAPIQTMGTERPTTARSPLPAMNSQAARELLVVGASTGGPIALKRLLSRLPASFGGAILVVQHIPQPFTSVLAAQLTSQTSFRAQVAQGGESCLPRCIYLAPGDKHLVLNSSQRLELVDGPPVRGNRPSIDITMKSVAQCFPYKVQGVLLTGMGDDGATGLAYLRSRGGTTYAQSGETCVVDSMPQSAIEMVAVDFVASPEGIADRLAQESLRHWADQASLSVQSFAHPVAEKTPAWRN